MTGLSVGKVQHKFSTVYGLRKVTIVLQQESETRIHAKSALHPVTIIAPINS
jgi:hypothetical protein